MNTTTRSCHDLGIRHPGRAPEILSRWAKAWMMGSAAVGAVLGTTPTVNAQDIADRIDEHVKRATVLVFTATSERQKADRLIGSGSGFFVNGRGMFITNNHVVDPAHGKSLRERQKIQLEHGRLSHFIVTDSGTENEARWECEILYQNEAADQALLQAGEKDGKPLRTPHALRFLPASKLKERMRVWAYGFPGGDSRRDAGERHAAVARSDGVVTRTPRTPSGRVRSIVTDVVGRPGNSGGPMVDLDGLVVGTVTLMGQAEGRVNTSMLVPAALSQRLIRAAFDQGRIPDGADVAPFAAFLTDRAGRMNVPVFTRLADRDTLFLGNGERIYGTLPADTITWASPFGDLKLPTEALAYVIVDEQGPSLFLEGGDRIASSKKGMTLPFTNDAGKRLDRRIDDLRAVAFKTDGTSPRRIRGQVIVLDSDVGRLVLTDVTGTVGLKERSGETQLALSDIARIDPGPRRGRRVVTLQDGRRMTGRFERSEFSATLAATGTPIKFGLGGITRATVEVLPGAVGSLGGMDLLSVLASADSELREIAGILEVGDTETARKRVNALRPKLAKMSKVSKARLRLLDGICALREGKADASKTIRKCNKAADPNVAAYARACVDVLKKFGTEYEGRPLSDADAFADAGEALAWDRIAEVRELLKDRDILSGRKGEYPQYMTAVKKHEKALKTAQVFAGAEADDDLVRLWNFAADVCGREVRRLRTEHAKKLAGRNRVPLVVFQALNKIVESHNRAYDQWVSYRRKLADYGFRLEDPDMHKFESD